MSVLRPSRYRPFIDVAFAAQALGESVSSPSPAYHRLRGEPPAPTPLPRRVAGAHEVAASMRFRELEVEVRTRPIMGMWTWFLRQTQGARELAPPHIEPCEGGVRLRVTARGPAANHVAFDLPLAPGERIVGFGERCNAVDQRGWRLETWAEEGAIGLGETLSPRLTQLGVPWNPFPKGPAVSYKPVPWFLSSRGYGVWVRTLAPGFFDVGASDPDTLRAEILTRELEIIVIYGPEPAQLIARFAQLTDGLPRGLPDWALGPWLDAIGGQERVREVARLARAHDIPCSVLWAEDWQGMERKPFGDSKWSYDAIFPVLRHPCRKSYPELERVIGELHEDGIKFLAYYYPYVSVADDDFAMADAAGYFLRDAAGQTRRFPMFMDECAQVDLTNPAARAWYKEELRRGARLGFDGWMADFGEYTPVDIVAHDGEDGLLHHNRVPLLWAELNRELLDEERPDGDYVFFSRSGAAGQQRDTPIFWGGDSNTDFERWDGLPGNLRALLSAGLSGFPLWTLDVGGYTCVVTRGRDAETLARWTELGALLLVMRTHHGTHERRCVQFDEDAATLAHFASYARLHAALYPLRRALVDEAVATGLPVARPLLVEHPDDAVAWAIEDQFLLGADLLVAPVLERGARERSVYLPAGRDWIDLWTGVRRAGGQRLDVVAPLGRIPLFLAADGMLPTFDTRIDTFVRRAAGVRAGLRTLDDAEGSLALFVGPDFREPLRLYDGTVVTRAEGGAPAGAPDPRGLLAEPHALLPAAMMASWRACAAGEGTELRLGDLMVRSPRSRRVRVFRPAP